MPCSKQGFPGAPIRRRTEGKFATAACGGISHAALEKNATPKWVLGSRSLAAWGDSAACRALTIRVLSTLAAGHGLTLPTWQALTISPSLHTRAAPIRV